MEEFKCIKEFGRILYNSIIKFFFLVLDSEGFFRVGGRLNKMKNDVELIGL